MTKIKICGVRSPEIAEFCDNLGVDFIGLNFVPESKRFIDPKLAIEIRKKVKNSKLVGIFVNAKTEYINEIASKVGLDLIQLHGNESPLICSAINLPVIKALSIELQSDIRATRLYKKFIQFFLFDSRCRYKAGGTGKCFNWEILEEAEITLPFFLAGGLNPDNVMDAIAKIHPYAVDVATGIESEGRSSKKKIEQFIYSIRKNET